MLHDNPDRVGDPVDPGPPFCDVCGESVLMGHGYYNCDGYYMCAECEEYYIRHTNRAPSWFVDWVAFMIEDFKEME